MTNKLTRLAIIIPIAAFLNRLRGSGWVKGDRVIASVLMGGLYVFVRGFETNWHTLYLFLTVFLGFLLWSSPAWLPRDNWSATNISDPEYRMTITARWYSKKDKKAKERVFYVAPVYWIKWYGWTVIRQLWCLPLFIGLSYLFRDLTNMVCSLPLIFGWGVCYYITSANCINLRWHTGWAELLVGAIWGLSLWLTLSM